MLLPPPLHEPSWSRGHRGPCRSCEASPLSKLSRPPRSPPSSSPPPPPPPPPRLLTSVERQ